MYRIQLSILLLIALVPSFHAYLVYKPRTWNVTCVYRAVKIPRKVFITTISSFDNFPLFPLDQYGASAGYDLPYQSCFGPGERYDRDLIVQGLKAPCKYRFNKDGSVNYQEEQACQHVHRVNCYCYALDRSPHGYCIPGLGARGRGFEDSDLSDCRQLTAGIIADGGRPVDRLAVYTEVPRGTHYIAAAVQTDPYADFHFWRLDGQRLTNGTIIKPIWSYKAGYTFIRNTFQDGFPVRNVQDPAARGQYTKFCGYFDVSRSKHKLGIVKTPRASIQRRFDDWKANNLTVYVTNTRRRSWEWSIAYSFIYVDAGWVDAAGAKRQPPMSPLKPRKKSPRRLPVPNAPTVSKPKPKPKPRSPTKPKPTPPRRSPLKSPRPAPPVKRKSPTKTKPAPPRRSPLKSPRPAPPVKRKSPAKPKPPSPRRAPPKSSIRRASPIKAKSSPPRMPVDQLSALGSILPGAQSAGAVRAAGAAAAAAQVERAMPSRNSLPCRPNECEWEIDNGK